MPDGGIDERNDQADASAELVIFAVIANVVVFASLAFTGNISGRLPSTIVFIDFWGRFVVYSLWIVAYVIYRRLFDDKPVIQTSDNPARRAQHSPVSRPELCGQD